MGEVPNTSPAVIGEKGQTGVKHEDIYNGVKINITTQRSPGGSWGAAAELASEHEKSLNLKGPFDTEEQAYRSALSLAIEAIDRSRSLIGKP